MYENESSMQVGVGYCAYLSPYTDVAEMRFLGLQVSAIVVPNWCFRALVEMVTGCHYWEAWLL